jgi:hypothetical protein
MISWQTGNIIEREGTMKFFAGVFVLAAVTLVIGAPADAREYLKQERAQSRGFSPGVVTDK